MLQFTEIIFFTLLHIFNRSCYVRVLDLIKQNFN